MFAEANSPKSATRTRIVFGMAGAGQTQIPVTESALDRARRAHERLSAIRDAEQAELELRNAAIVEAYENGAGTRRIARDLGMSATTVNDVIAAR